VLDLADIVVGSKSLLWKYSMGQKKGLHAFGYNFAESEPIWMKSGTVWAKCWRLALADFGRDLLSSDSLRGSRNFVFFCELNNAQFHRYRVGQIYDIWTQQRQLVSPCENFRNRILKILP